MNEKLFIGDSITRYWPLGAYWSNTVNAGVPGQDTPAIKLRLPALIAQYPDASVAVLGGGTNNLNNSSGWNQAASDLSDMGDMCVAAGIPFVVCLPPPRLWDIEGLIAAISAMCFARGWTPADFYHAMMDANGNQIADGFVDGTHPISMRGYNVMSNVLAAHIPLDYVPLPSAAQVARLLLI